jgi:hypothetical protein
MTIHEGGDDRAMDLESRGGAEPWGDEPLGDEQPLYGEDEFAQEVRELVADEAPRVSRWSWSTASGLTAGSSPGGWSSRTASR